MKLLNFYDSTLGENEKILNMFFQIRYEHVSYYLNNNVFTFLGFNSEDNYVEIKEGGKYSATHHQTLN